MKIIIFGANGGTGKQLIKQALLQGQHVTAFVRDAKKISIKHENLSVFEGDALNQSDVTNAIKEHDAVLCTLGMTDIMDKSGLREKGTNNIIHAMHQLNINRLICQSSLGAGNSYSKLPFIYKAIIAPLLMRRLYKDHNAQEKSIQASNLAWTIVRPGVLSDGELTQKYKYGHELDQQKIKAKISRADTADFILKQLNSSTLLYHTPYISY